jgi:creatinine amidohydrolase
MARMNWEAYRDAVNDRTVAVIPLGSTELEGVHLPLGVDTLAAEAVAGRLDGEPGVIIGPALPIGYSKWFTPFPGTVTLEQDTLCRVLGEYGDCLVRDGIRRLIFLNAHKGNNAAVTTVSHELIARHGISVAMLSIWKLAHDMAAARPGWIREGRFTHAGEIMTSVMMAAAPDSVAREKIAPGGVRSPQGLEFKIKNSLGDTEFRGSVQTVFQDIRQVTDTGVLGDPGAASAEKGESLIACIADYTRAFLREFRKLPLAVQKA